MLLEGSEQLEVATLNCTTGGERGTLRRQAQYELYWSTERRAGTDFRRQR